MRGLKEQKDAMIAALWANPNWDDTKESQGNRKHAVSGINEDYEEALEAIEAAIEARDVPDEGKLADDNPFFAAAERGLEKVDQRVAQLKARGHSVGSQDDEISKYDRDIDQF